MSTDTELQQRTPQERSERLVEVEEQFRSQHREQLENSIDTDTDTTDPAEDPQTPVEDLPPLTAHILDAERTPQWRTDKLLFTLKTASGDVVETRLPWPDDPTDETEPVARLCNWVDVDPLEFADIGDHNVHVPVKENGSSYAIHVPPVDAPGNNALFAAKRRLMQQDILTYRTPSNRTSGYMLHPKLLVGAGLVLGPAVAYGFYFGHTWLETLSQSLGDTSVGLALLAFIAGLLCLVASGVAALSALLALWVTTCHIGSVAYSKYHTHIKQRLFPSAD